MACTAAAPCGVLAADVAVLYDMLTAGYPQRALRCVGCGRQFWTDLPAPPPDRGRPASLQCRVHGHDRPCPACGEIMRRARQLGIDRLRGQRRRCACGAPVPAGRWRWCSTRCGRRARGNGLGPIHANGTGAAVDGAPAPPDSAELGGRGEPAAGKDPARNGATLVAAGAPLEESARSSTDERGAEAACDPAGDGEQDHPEPPALLAAGGA